MADRNLE